MASDRRAVVFLILYSSFLVSPALSEPQKVSLALYYEALCPFCSRFVVHSLSKVFNGDIFPIIDLRLVPFGNAHIGSNSSISCQHGSFECFLNTVEACAIYSWPNVQQHFGFIYCVERLVLENKHNEWESCFQNTGLDQQALVNCYNSGLGQEIELQYGAQTAALVPPHRYVPWVVVNGLPLYDVSSAMFVLIICLVLLCRLCCHFSVYSDYDSFVMYVCEAYEGELPNACEKLSLRTPQQIKSNSANKVRTNA
ncbi:hypothetical protein AXF42_Ash003966 [Apostasia shenzhenica]|uniref:Gamma-interferon-inducible lysosomal thiol reductase n=1 Tax=Apostasia shenzhenica TaxID=1088818 RepID=A0A2I0AIF5_9ASPA|nr:hypothetical protein AXF42_Ash003966 [Apostasia shenzhenica]